MKIISGIQLWRWTQPLKDLEETINRVPRQHIGWQSIIYKGKRYQLGGGIRTDYFINLDNPIVGRLK